MGVKKYKVSIFGDKGGSFFKRGNVSNVKYCTDTGWNKDVVHWNW